MRYITVWVNRLWSTKTTPELLALAKQQIESQEINAAIISLKNAVSLTPQNAEARLLLADTYLTIGNIKGAEKEVEKAKSLGANLEQVTIIEAQLLLQQREYSQAANILENAKEALSVSTAEHAKLLLAISYMGLNELSSKRFILEEFKALC